MQAMQAMHMQVDISTRLSIDKDSPSTPGMAEEGKAPAHVASYIPALSRFRSLRLRFPLRGSARAPQV